MMYADGNGELVCRACRNEISQFIPLAAKVERQKEFSTVFDLFKKYTFLEIETKQQTNAGLCTHCYNILVDFHKFQQMCLASHLKFLQEEFSLASESFRQRAVRADREEPAKEQQEETIVKQEPVTHVKQEQVTDDEIDEEEDVKIIDSDDDFEEIFSIKDIKMEQIEAIGNRCDIMMPSGEGCSSSGSVSPITLTTELHSKQNKTTGGRSKRYKCQQCGFVFTNSSNLKRHTLIHQSMKYECSICHDKKRTKYDLKQHILNTHVPNEKHNYVCEVCLKVFNLASTLELHMKQHPSKIRYKCPFCDHVNYNHSSARAHMRSSHNVLKTNSDFECRYCEEPFPDVDAIKEHLLTHSGLHAICGVCFKCYDDVSSLQLHIKLEHAQLPPMEIVEDESQSINNFENVVNDIEENTDQSCTRVVESEPESSQEPVTTAADNIKNFFASPCDAPAPEATDRSELNHIINKQVVSCSLCSCVYNTESGLRKHKLREHGAELRLYENRTPAQARQSPKLPSNKEGKFICKLCKRDFNTVKYLEVHMCFHYGIKNYPCHICGRKFETPSNRNRHLKTHGEKLSVTVNNGKLSDENMDVDHDVLKKQCANAENRMHSASNIVKTQKSYAIRAKDISSLMQKPSSSLTGKLPVQPNRQLDPKKPASFSCHLCLKTFTAAKHLETHMCFHYGIKNYGCPICGRKFETQSNRNRHLKVHDKEGKSTSVLKAQQMKTIHFNGNGVRAVKTYITKSIRVVSAGDTLGTSSNNMITIKTENNTDSDGQ